MENRIDLLLMADKIKLLRDTAEELLKTGNSLPMLEKNTDRILASIKMLELNISDLVEPSPGSE